MEEKVKASGNIYKIYADRKTSQFDQTKQIMRCRILEAHRGYLLVESLKRYNKKYAGACTAKSGKYEGMPIRRINKDQIIAIIDEATDRPISYSTVRRREGTSVSPGRSRDGK